MQALMSTSTTVFVFGSNLAGRHGKGAALAARSQHGAIYGVGKGRTGNAYAIPTKSGALRTLPLEVIEKHVDDFINYAHNRYLECFHVTRVGCGLAGYEDWQIAPMFKKAPVNCSFDIAWIRYLPKNATIYPMDSFSG